MWRTSATSCSIRTRAHGCSPSAWSKGSCPADYLERPANHRESILNLPDLSRDDIAEYYDRFTALRQRLHVARYGAALNAAVENVAMAARTG